MPQHPHYTESSIKVLKGLEPVKERPGMYTRTDSPTHIIQEVIDNAADEALGGHATRISVEIHADQSITVRDNGRGIPTGNHPTEHLPVVELVFTQLHAGGKFNKTEGSGAYAFSGGLHGVGVSVTNALSKRLDVTVKRDGKIQHIAFAGGDVVEPLHQIGTCAQKDTGTEVRVYPDARYFENPSYNLAELERLLRAKAVLLKGVEVSLTRPSKGQPENAPPTTRRVCPYMARRRHLRQRKLCEPYPHPAGRHARSGAKTSHVHRRKQLHQPS